MAQRHLALHVVGSLALLTGSMACGASPGETSESVGEELQSVRPLIPYRLASTSKTSDTNGDGRSDLVFQSYDGHVAAWQMQANGLSMREWHSDNTVPSSYGFVGATDLNGDGRADFVWNDYSNGTTVIWYMGVVGPASKEVRARHLSQFGSTDVTAVGDFDGDNVGDLLYCSTSYAYCEYQGRSGAFVALAAPFGGTPYGYVPLAVGDFDGNGLSDVLFRNASAGYEIHFTMPGNALSVVQTGALVGDWRIAGVGDLDRDGLSDVIVQQVSTGRVGALAGAGHSAFRWVDLGSADPWWYIDQIGDFDGDGFSDILWEKSDFCPAQRPLSVWLMNGFALKGWGNLSTSGSNWASVPGPSRGTGLTAACAPPPPSLPNNNASVMQYVDQYLAIGPR